MPPLLTVFDSELKRSLAIAKAGESMRFSTDKSSRRAWTDTKLEALYELAYMRIFVAWETFLLESFYHYLAGCVSATHGAATPVTIHYKSRRYAEKAVLAGRGYILLHKPSRACGEFKKHIAAGRNEIVVDGNATALTRLGYVRHRIAHGHSDARKKFDAVTNTLIGSRVRGSRPGKFLRQQDHAKAVFTRWLETLAGDLGNIAGQII